MPQRTPLGPPSASEMLLTNPDELSAAMASIQDKYNKAKPTRTQAAYNPKIKEWKQWCKRRNPPFPDGDFVHGDKLAFFLETEVKGREHRKRGAVKGRRRGGKAAETEAATAVVETEDRPQPESDSESEGGETEQNVIEKEKGKEVEYSTVEGYASALVSLYTQQLTAGLHNYANPRNANVRAILATYRLEKNEKERKNFVDRGIGTFADGYGPGKTIADLANSNFERNNSPGLRDRLVSLFCHHAILRGENARNLQLPDLQSVELSENEGHTRATALVLVIKNGKRNQTGRLEMAGMMRHKDWEACPQGGLAFHLFDRFHVHTHQYPPSNFSFPSFDTPQQWYNIYLFNKQASPFEAITYDTHRTAEASALQLAGIVTKKRTHFQRGTAAREADMAGASTDDLRRHGRWENQQSMMQAYLTNLPRTSMRALAGFNPNGGCYFLAREIEPPSELMEQLWPDADKWLHKHKTAECTPNLAAVGFLTLLIYLRRVFLQDAVLLQVKYPDLFLFNHKLFGTPEWASWSKKLLRHLANVDDPTELRLEKAMPHQLEFMKAQHGANVKHHLENASTLEDLLAKVDMLVDGQEMLQSFMRQMMTGGAYVMETEEVTRKKRMQVVFDRDDGDTHHQGGTSRSLREESQDLPPLPFSHPSTTTPNASSTHPSLPASPSASRRTANPTSPIRTQLPSHRFNAFLYPTSASTTNPSSSAAPNAFEMSSSVTTVVDLWREYEEGINGRTSLKVMLAAGWKMAEKERKRWERRRNIIKEVKRLSGEGVSSRQAAMLLEERRRAENLHLNAFDKKFKPSSAKGK